jgi:hypothetical protein
VGNENQQKDDKRKERKETIKGRKKKYKTGFRNPNLCMYFDLRKKIITGYLV